MINQSIFRSIVNQRELVWEMAMRDLKGLTKGAFLGWVWLVLSPLIQTAAYVFVVAFIFRPNMGDASSLDYALYVLSGMVCWQVLTRSLAAAPMLIRARMELVKQVIYPIETLPITTLIVGSVGSFVSACVFLLLALYAGLLHWTVLLFPIPFALLLLFVLGTSWLFMIAGVIVKDLRDIVTTLLGLLAFLSPVMLTESMTGAGLWKWILLNPLAHAVICFRDVFWATFHPTSWIVFTAMALVSYGLGAWVIRKTKTLINEYI